MPKRYPVVLWIVLICFFTALFLLFAVEEKNIVDDEKTNKRYKIEMILKAKANPPDFWMNVEQGANMAAAEYNVDCEVMGPASEAQIDKQIELVKKAIAKQPDAIILAASDYKELAPICQEADRKGILIITLDSDVDYGKPHSFVGTDNYAMGEKLAQLVNGLVNDTEKFGIVGHVKTVSTAMEREKGVLENLKKCSDQFVGISYCNGSVDLAKNEAIEMLKTHPDIGCMVGLNESSTLGIAYGIQKLGLQNRVKLVGCDCSEKEIELIEQGIIHASVIQNPYSMGYISVQNAVQILNKEPVPNFYDTGSVIVSKQTLYTTENEKLLFPFTDGN